jgi:hypothetical protein
MSQDDWTVAEEPVALLKMVEPIASDRKMRMLACGCCRLIWDDLSLEPVRAVVEMSEKYADGLVSADDLNESHNRAVITFVNTLHEQVRLLTEDPAEFTRFQKAARVNDCCHVGKLSSEKVSDLLSAQGVKERGSELLREIFGNPFRPVSFDPAWRTSTAVALAQQMYDGRDFSLMPIPGDALQDAGCEHADILDHCRSAGPHVRGCWVVDLVLGKE